MPPALGASRTTLQHCNVGYIVCNTTLAYVMITYPIATYVMPARSIATCVIQKKLKRCDAMPITRNREGQRVEERCISHTTQTDENSLHRTHTEGESYRSETRERREITPSEHRASTERAPSEHRASTERAPTHCQSSHGRSRHTVDLHAMRDRAEEGTHQYAHGARITSR